MDKILSHIQVIEKTTGEVLFQGSLEQRDQAFDFAKSMEEMGLDIEIKSPSVTETLITELGANADEIESYKESLEHEIDSHND